VGGKKMRKRFVLSSAIVALLMLVSIQVMFTPNELNVVADPLDLENLGLVGLDYQEIYNITKEFSDITFDNNNGVYNGIYMGRYFGATGDRHSANLTRSWMENFSRNLNMVEAPQKDPISLNKKIELRGFGLKFKQGIIQATVPNNESFPIMYNFFGGVGTRKYYSCQNADVKLFSFDNRGDFPESSDYSVFNVSYIGLNNSEDGFHGEVTHIDNYSNASEEDIFAMVHLLNVSDSDLNDTVDSISRYNGSGFILMRDMVSNIIDWEYPIPGVVVSVEDGDLLKDLVEDENQNVTACTPFEVPIPERGNLTIVNMTSYPPICPKEFLLYDKEEWRDFADWQKAIFYACYFLPRVKGILEFDSLYDYGIHWMAVPNGAEFSEMLDGNFKTQKWAWSIKPWIYINRTITDDNGVNRNIDDWVDDFDVDADFWIDMKKVETDSYNVYCTVRGENSEKRVIISGGHFDGYWGQMSVDTPISVAIMLGMLKYLNESQITPKYDTTFIAFSGEEWIDRGSRSYVVQHFNTWDGQEDPNDVEMLITADVLAYTDCSTLEIRCSDINSLPNAKVIRNKTENISFLTDYDGVIKTTAHKDEGVEGNDCYPFYYEGIPFIEIGEANYLPIRHKTGCDHTKGDTIDKIDWSESGLCDLKLTTDLIWNITKYYIVNPDCWFKGAVEYEAVDSPNDGDTLVDSIEATFMVKSAIPNDKVMIKGILIDNSTSEEVAFITKNFTVSSSEAMGSISILIPPTYTEGDFRLLLELYNSTGRIDKIIDPEGDYYNDTDSSNSFHLYHPFGYINKGKSGQSIANRITGSVFTINENGTADNITAFVLFPLAMPPVKSKCMIYKLSDSKLVGVTEEISGKTLDGGEWRSYNFLEPKPVLYKDTQYILVCWCDHNDQGGELYYDDFEDERGRYDIELYGLPPQYADFRNESRLYSIYCSYTPQQSTSEMTFYFDHYNIFEAWATNPRDMVDGSTSTYASTTILGDVELCNESTYEPTHPDYPITKVEIRAWGTAFTLGNFVALRPVFDGTTDGNNHTFELGHGWSQWFDITNDNNAPSPWTWQDVANLDCDVEAWSGSGPWMISKVELRVSWT